MTMTGKFVVATKSPKRGTLFLTGSRKKWRKGRRVFSLYGWSPNLGRAKLFASQEAAIKAARTRRAEKVGEITATKIRWFSVSQEA